MEMGTGYGGAASQWGKMEDGRCVCVLKVRVAVATHEVMYSRAMWMWSVALRILARLLRQLLMRQQRQQQQQQQQQLLRSRLVPSYAGDPRLRCMLKRYKRMLLT